MLALLWILLALVVVGVDIWLIRSKTAKSSDRHRAKIGGQTCPNCGSDEVYWAGYSDRKECGKCGKIFS
jgi:ribosomal protein S27AE